MYDLIFASREGPSIQRKEFVPLGVDPSAELRKTKRAELFL